MVDFNEIFEEIKKSIALLISNTLQDFKKNAEKDVNDFYEKSKEKLQRWTKSLTDGGLTKEDFEFLVKSQKDLLELSALKQAGLAEIRLDKFKNDVLNVVINTIFKLIK